MRASHEVGFHETFLDGRMKQDAHQLRADRGGRGVGAVLRGRPCRGARHGRTPDGFSQPYISAISYGSAYPGFAAVVVSAHRAPSCWTRALASLVILIGTPLVFYAAVAPASTRGVGVLRLCVVHAPASVDRPRWDPAASPAADDTGPRAGRAAGHRSGSDF
jgi:hypothetical protein